LEEIEIQERVIKLVSDATKVDVAKISPTTTFVDDLNLDSLDIVELMMKMEDEFGVEIPEDEAEGLKSVADVVTYIEKKQ
jgi:acyl carrier protein